MGKVRRSPNPYPLPCDFSPLHQVTWDRPSLFVACRPQTQADDRRRSSAPRLQVTGYFIRVHPEAALAPNPRSAEVLRG